MAGRTAGSACQKIRQRDSEDYFETLAKQYNNFTFHIVLSDPQPEDHWASYTGLIHEVLKRVYFDSHPASASIDDFFGGLPAMIHAAMIMLKNFGVPPTQIAYDEF